MLVIKINLLPVLFAMLINEFKNNQSTQCNGVGYNQFFKTNIDLQLKLFTLLHVHDTIYLLKLKENYHQLQIQFINTAITYLTVNKQNTKVIIFSRGKVKKHQNLCLEAHY